MPNLDDVQITRLASRLPAISTVPIKVYSLIEDPNTTREEIFDLVASDQTLFAECFKQANSVAVSSLRKYRTINEIVDILGFNLVKKVSLFIAAKSVISDPTIWFESVFTAVAAKHLAVEAGYDEIQSDRAYMAGLFVNYGSFFIKKFYNATYERISKIENFQERIAEEIKVFGYCYPELSAKILSRWNLPQYVVSVIANQVNIYNPDRPHDNINAFLEIARRLYLVRGGKVDVRSIRNRLAIDEIRELVGATKLDLKKIGIKTFNEIECAAKEFAF
jgi:HD-like signal output (HDOD) protein